ncbi:MAG TPA: MCP four helix bundle domain-containing protein, partial [Methylophilus sp.]|nr:MCP four helix bundle domain-containing protein [Methylophilus sp.]
MTIAKRMYLLIASCAIAMVILIGFTLTQVVKVYEYTNQANANSIPSILELSKAENYYQRLRLNLLRHVSATTPAEKAKLAAQIHERRKVVEEAMNNYKDLTTDSTDKEMFTQEQSMLAGYFDQMTRVLALSDAGSPEAASLLQTADKVAIELANKLDDHMVYNQKTSLVHADNAAAIKDKALWQSAAIALLCLTVIVVTGVMITRRLRAQLGMEPSELSVIARNFVEGNLNQKITLPENDKTSVAYSIRTLQKTLDGLVQSLNYVSQQHDEGDIDCTVDQTRFKGGYGEMAAGINKMVAGHIAMNKEAIEVVKAFGEGNLDAPLKQFPGKKAFVNEAIEQVRSNIKRLVSDADELAHAAVDGRLSTRADATKHQGDFRKIVQGVNDTLDAVINPLNVAAQYVSDISKGNIPAKITDHYHGDFNTIKDNLNQCIDAVNALVGDANLLSKAAVDGQLSTRADASKHQGDFRKIVEGVNAT